MSLERLWTGWRGRYVSSVPSEEERDPSAPACVFCRILESGHDDAETYIVRRGSTGFVILNAYPYASGHLLAMPYRHEAQLSSLTPDESAELWRLLRDGAAALEAAYRPEGLNIGFNLGRVAGAGIPDHLHGHVVPRWGGDTNFMTSVANARVLPEALDATWAKVRDAWPVEGGDS